LQALLWLTPHWLFYALLRRFFQICAAPIAEVFLSFLKLHIASTIGQLFWKKMLDKVTYASLFMV
jgi:hypothetical protein